MASGTTPGPETRVQEPPCRLVVRKEKGLAEILQFVTAGLEMGQQVVALGGPTCLKDLARALSESGLRPDPVLRNGRLIFLTAPDCLSRLTISPDPLRRVPVRRNASVLRWVSDWSWAYSNGADLRTIQGYQQRVHEFVRSVTPLSLCTVHCEKLERSSLLAILADHRRAAKGKLMPERFER